MVNIGRVGKDVGGGQSYINTLKKLQVLKNTKPKTTMVDGNLT